LTLLGILIILGLVGYGDLQDTREYERETAKMEARVSQGK
jgi:hypothetical protein